VAEAAGEAKGNSYRITAGSCHELQPRLGGWSSFGSINLSGDELKLRREMKKPFPPE
jgi:hypothetical protein